MEMPRFRIMFFFMKRLTLVPLEKRRFLLASSRALTTESPWIFYEDFIADDEIRMAFRSICPIQFSRFGATTTHPGAATVQELTPHLDAGTVWARFLSVVKFLSRIVRAHEIQNSFAA